MSLVTTSSTVASIVPFDPTTGITIVASVMLALFVLAMVVPAIAPLVSSTWANQSPPNGRSVPEATGGETTESEATGATDAEAAAATEAETAGATDVKTAEAAGAEAGAGGAASDRDDAGESASGPFTSDEIGKLVEQADGKVIGTVASVSGETARVEPKPDALDQLLIRLDRKEAGVPFDLEADSVREISDTRVHLERDFSEPTARSTGGDEDPVSSAKQ